VAASYPYALTPKRIPILFERVAKVGVPDTADDKWLSQVGLASSNDRRLKNMLRYIGFTDEKYTPTALWREYRGAGGPSKLAEGIRTGYAALFEMFPYAHLANDSAIAGFIKGSTSLSGSTVDLAVATFKALIQLADFGQAHPAPNATKTTSSNGAGTKTIPEDTSEEPAVIDKRVQGPGVTINVNLQLTLPESKDPAVYEALFAALAKHVLPSNA